MYYGDSFKLDLKLYIQDIRHAVEACIFGDKLQYTTKANILGTLYKKGHFILIEIEEGKYIFGKIEMIIYDKEMSTYFLVEKYEDQFNHDCGLHILNKCNSYKCVEHVNLPLYTPLEEYSVNNVSTVSLKYLPLETHSI
jgi:hypothetical protein